MKRLLGTVVALVLLWYALFAPLMTTDWAVREYEIPDGPLIVIPGLSGNAIPDLKELPLSKIVVSYARERGVYFVYPDTLLMTISAPWIWEKTRYPLLEKIASALEAGMWLHELPVSLPQSEFVPVNISQVDSSLYFHEDSFVIEQIVTVYNASVQHSLQWTLPLGPEWEVYNLEGEGLDYIIDGVEKRAYVPLVLSPGHSGTYILVLRKPTELFIGYVLAECTFVLADDGVNTLSIRDNGAVVLTYEIRNPTQARGFMTMFIGK